MAGGGAVIGSSPNYQPPPYNEWYRFRILSQTEKLEQQNKQYHGKELLSSFYLNGHTLGFHLQTQKIEPLSKV